MTSMDDLIVYARERGCSDIHLTPGLPVTLRRVGVLAPCPELELPEKLVQDMIESILPERQRLALEEGQDADFCYTLPDGRRQRVNVYFQQGVLCCALRILNEHIPTLDELMLPEVLKRLALLPRGLVLVTGPTGSGKSTTLAAMVAYINENSSMHILTIEDPVEYRHESRRSLIHQREVGEDTPSFAAALRSALREDPDVILVGEMRDHETISAALTAAETGHLVFSTLHTTGAANTVDRIIDVFPPEGQRQIRAQLSMVLQGVITQQLVPSADGTARYAALEILLGSDAVRNLIRDNKSHQLVSAMQTGAKDGMQTLAKDLSRLVSQGKITAEAASTACPDRQELAQYLGARSQKMF